jgi:hypothetical protein
MAALRWWWYRTPVDVARLLEARRRRWNVLVVVFWLRCCARCSLLGLTFQTFKNQKHFQSESFEFWEFSTRKQIQQQRATKLHISLLAQQINNHNHLRRLAYCWQGQRERERINESQPTAASLCRLFLFFWKENTYVPTPRSDNAQATSDERRRAYSTD